MLIDTHCHMNLMIKKTFDTPINEEDLIKADKIVEEAEKKNVNYIVNAGTNIIENLNCIKIAQRYKNLYSAIGIHPTDIKNKWKEEIEKIKNLLKNKTKNKIVAIGEIGLDFYWPGYNKNEQKIAFKTQIELAIENNLPIIIHVRNDQDEEIFECLEEYKNQVKGIFHCFSQDLNYAKKVIDYNFLLGIGGIISYPKNEILRNVIKTIDLNHIVLETDAPFLPPQIARGKENHPKYLAYIAKYVAELRGQSFEVIAEETTKKCIKPF